MNNIEFIEENHIYLYKGVEIPSVSQFLHWLFPDKYKNVNKVILQAKAVFGTKIHQAIENYENKEELPKMTYIEELCFKQYLKLKEKYDILPVTQEQIITDSRIAGRLDMIGLVGKVYTLLDIKTTAQLDKDYLSWQLSTYEYLHNFINKDVFDDLACIWLPKKELGQFVTIKRIDRDYLLEKLNEFLKEREEKENEYKY